MKRNLLYGLGALAMAMTVVAGCSDTFKPVGTQTGRIVPSVTVSGEVVTARSATSRGTAQQITTDDLSLSLRSADGQIERHWASVSDFNTNEEFRVGAYTMEAWYGTEQSEGFESPWYHGEALLTVAENETTNVGLTVALSNAMLTINTTDAFKEYFDAWSFDVTTASGASHVYASDEVRPVYVKPGQVNISATVTKPNGVTGTLNAATLTAVACHHYTVTVDVNGGQAGAAEMVITFDDLVDQEDVIIDLSDDLISTPAPEVIVKGFDPEEHYIFIDGIDADIEPSLFINARAGIKSVMMTTSSRTLTEQGWPSGEIDLTKASLNEQTTLKNMGMEVLGLYNNVDCIASIDMSGVIANLRYREAGANSTTLTFVVTDNLGKTAEPVTLNIDIVRIEMELTAASTLEYQSDSVDLNLVYNGDKVDTKVAIQYINERGTWSEAVFTSTDNGDGTYTLHVSGLPTEDNVTVRANFLNGYCITPNVVLERASGIVVSSSPAQVFAKHAQLNLKMSADLNPADAVVEISDDGSTYARMNAPVVSRSSSNSTYDLTDLAPSTTYSVRVSIGEIESYTTITTEAAEQLPNADMETWSQASNGRNWELIYPGDSADASVWGTNNPMTTSQGSDYAYCRISGTISTTDSHSGKAALIRTVGWGSGNSAFGSNGNSGTTKYVDAGLLHIGSSRAARPEGYSSRPGALTTDDLDCGIAFVSRPDAISFWYKYTAKNSADQGYAEVIITDAEGTVIASSTQLLAATTTYTEVEMPLTYVADGKAAKIYVKFMSTHASSFLEKNDNNLSGPGFGNLSRGTYMGSQLYIDDITLKY